MKRAIATGLTLAGLAWLPPCVAQTAGIEQVDAARGRIWSLTSQGVSLRPVSQPQQAVALPGWHWAGAPYSTEPALAIGPGGEVIVTSDIAPILWRVDPVSFAVSIHPLALDADTDKDIGFSALAYSREHDAFVGVSGSQGSVWLIDRPLTRARKLRP